MKKSREISQADYQPDVDYADFMMSFEEYANLENRDSHRRYELHNGDKSLLVNGVHHFTDPENPSFSEIADDVKNFKPDLILVEGMEMINHIAPEQLREIPDFGTAEEVLKRFGENAYLAKLAIDNNIEVKSPEVSAEYRNTYALEHGVTKEAIFVDEVAALVHQYHRLTDQPPFEEYIQPYLERVKTEWGWNDFDNSMDNFKVLYKNYVGREFDLEDKEIVKLLSDPVPWSGQPFNEVRKAAQLITASRDKFIIEEIEKALKTHDRIYIVYGATHMVMQEPALRKMFDANQE